MKRRETILDQPMADKTIMEKLRDLRQIRLILYVSDMIGPRGLARSCMASSNYSVNGRTMA